MRPTQEEESKIEVEAKLEATLTTQTGRESQEEGKQEPVFLAAEAKRSGPRNSKDDDLFFILTADPDRIEEFTKMFKENPRLSEATYAGGSSVIFKAASSGNLEAFKQLAIYDKELLSSKYKGSEDRCSSLASFAVLFGCTEMLETIFEHAPTQFQETDPKNGLTLLQFATKTKDIKTHQLITGKEAEENTKLLQLKIEAITEMVHLIAKKEVEANNVIFGTIKEGNLEEFKTLTLNDKELLKSEYKGSEECSTPASFVVLHGNVEMLETIFEIDPERFLDIDPKNGLILLQFATKENQPEMLQLIAEKGAEKSGINFVAPQMPGTAKTTANLKNKTQSTALHIAIGEKNPENIALLLTNGSDPQTKNRIKQNALTFACSNTDTHTMANELLSSTVESLGINEKSGKGDYTPIFYATHLDNEDLIKALVEKGASVLGRYNTTRGTRVTLEEVARSPVVTRLLSEIREKEELEGKRKEDRDAPNAKTTEPEANNLLVTERGERTPSTVHP